MKYLSKYNESKIWNIIHNRDPLVDDEMVDTISDILISDAEIYELDYILDFTWRFRKSKNNVIVYFRDRNNRFFTLNEIRDMLFRIKDVCNSFGYSIDMEIPSEEDTLYSFQDFIKEFGGDELYRLKIIIYKEGKYDKKNESNSYEGLDEICSNLKDICTDITDEGKFDVFFLKGIRYGGYFQMMIHLKNHLDYDGFHLSEVVDVLDRIRDYLGDSRFGGMDAVAVGDPGRIRLKYIGGDDKLTNIRIMFRE